MSKSKRRSRHFGRSTRFESLEHRIVLDSQIGSVTMPYDGYVSAAVYNSNGDLIRTLLRRSSADQGVSVPLMWDGKDDVGRVVQQDGTFTWKALTSQVDAVDEGGVGDSVYSPNQQASGYTVDFTFALQNVAVDSSGNFYQISLPTENGNSLQKFSPDGQLLNRYGAQGQGVAVDSTYLYVSGRNGNQDAIYRIAIATGAYTGFTGVPGGTIVVNNDAFDPRPPGQNRYTTEQIRQKNSTWGIAVDNSRVWVSNYRNNRVEIYDKVTGVMLGQLAVNKPMGIAIETSGPASGTIWVANNNDQVSRYNFTVSGSYSFTEDITRRIQGLDDPTGITIGGPSNHLFIAETGAGHIREYNIASTPVLAGWEIFGNKYLGGPIQDNDIYPTYFNGIAVDSTGILNIVDDHRILRYYTATGGGHTAGELKQMLYGLFGGYTVDSYGYTSDGKYFLYNSLDVYEVDSLYTGGPRAGWLGDGTWRLASRNVLPSTAEDNGVMETRTLMDGATPREFRYMYYGSGFEIFAVNTDGSLRRSAYVGGTWAGVNMIDDGQPGKYVWADSDGDGQIDWNGVGSGVDGEVTWYTPLGQQSGLGALSELDEQGNIWYATSVGTIIKVPLEGFDGQGNPLYNFNNAITVVPFTNDDYRFVPSQVHLAANGDIYASGTTNFPVGTNFWVGGPDWYARYDSNGNRLLLTRTPDTYSLAFAVDETDPTGSYFYSSHSNYDEFWIHMYTNDGLLVARASPGDATDVWMGWSDHPWAVHALTQPFTGKTYMYGSDISNGKAERFRVDNLNTIQRTQGNFNWTYSIGDPVERWTFDGKLQDSIGHNDGTFFGGSPNYAYGQQGTSVDLDGVDDRIELPRSSATNSAYTISAWVKPTDTSGVSILTGTGGGGTASAGIEQLRINNSGQFEFYSYDGTGHTITGTTLAQPGSWYHVVGTLQGGGMMHLYINGQEEGSAQSIGFPTIGSDRFHVGDPTAFTSSWFDGLVDDIRVYELPLRATDVRALYDEFAAERDGYWALDSNLNDSAGTINGSFIGDAPSYVTGMYGQAVNFDGVDDLVSLPYATDPESYTISAWIKPTDTTSVSILTRTSASGPATDFFDQLRINSSGQFEHFTNDGTGHTVIGTTVAQPGVWYHVVGTATGGGKMRLYVNGKEEGLAQSIGALSTAGDRFYVGSNSGGGMGYFQGLIDDVRVYNEVASALDVEDLFHNGDALDYKGLWAFENNVNDSAGSNNGTFNGGTAAYATGKIGNAIDLDGSNDFVNIPYATDPTAYTISAWVRPTDVTSVNIINRTDASGPSSSYSHEIGINSAGKFQHYNFTPDGNMLVTGTTSAVSNTWYHVAAVAQTNGMMRLYVNGKEEGTAVAIGSLLTSGDRFHVGNAGGGFSFGFFDGLVDDLRIYERALSADELDSIYDGKGPADVSSILSTVSVVATDNKAAETGSDPGIFTITRDHNVGNLVVNYAMSGVAGNGSDYSSLSGSVTIPSGQSSVTVTVIPIDDPSNDPSETVIITLTGGSYTVGTPSSATVMIADNEATGDIAWTGSNNTPNGTNGNNYGWSYNTNEANGTTGEIGGTVARAQVDNYYADTYLSSTLNLGNTISGSGKFDIPSISAGWAGSGSSGFFIGHFSKNPASREFIGLEFVEGSPTAMQVRARFQVPTLGGADTAFTPVSINGNHTFSYTYNPNLGANGRLSISIDSQPVLTVDLSDGERASGAQFDAFGLGATDNQNSETDVTKTAQIFMDDLTYTGFQAGVLPPAVTVSASDPSAAEVGANTGTFTVTRIGTSGNLTVNYTVSGTAVSGTDYSTLSGSVVIPNGQSSANFTVTPIDDNVVEASKEVVVTLSSSINYTLGVPKSAGVTIADNEPTVIITATDASGAEVGPDTGTFTIIRGGTSGNLTVNYTVSGMATSGSDFSVLSGSVVIPNGQTSATVTVTPINDSLTEGGETVTLEVASGTGYAVGATNRATMTISDNDAQGNPGWTASKNALFGNNFGWSDTTKEAGGVRGEIGGTFTRSKADSNIADTNLSSSFNLNNTITASGKFDVHNLTEGWASSGASAMFIGHFSQSTSSNEFIGLEIREWRPDAVRIIPRFLEPAGGGSEGELIRVTVDGDHTFSYTYDPNLGANGRLTVLIDSRPVIISDLSPGERASGAVFNAFGMGVWGNENSETDPTKTIQVFVDDLNYSGRQTAGLPSVMVDATDPSAAEPSSTGTFTVTRTGTSGNLTVNYTVAGSAGSGTDYSALSGSVIIPNGQSSANVTVTSIDDLVAESNKTVVLTLSTSANYYLTNSTSATVTIVDNEPTVTVTASDSIAQEQGLDTGTYTFTRTNSSGNLIVFYTMSGSATAPDYAALPGSVTIPNGQTSATVTLTPVDDPSPESSEFAILTISANSAYFTGLPNSATVTITDNDTLSGVNFDKNPGWTGSNRTNLGNNYGWSPATSQAGGTTGEAGGTFARALADSYYADTLLSQTFNLNNTISATGKFDALGITSGWADVAGNSGLFIGHFSRGASNKEFIGLELKEDPTGLTSQMQVRARLQLPGGAGTAFSGWVNVSTNGNHTFSYTYNPALGANGRLTLNIDALSPLTVDLSAGDRTSGSAFDAFGLGYTSNLNSENAPAKTAQVFIDDVSYSGYQPSVTVAPTDSNTAEAGNNTATFTLTRTNANGNLVVNYLATGVVTAGTDYSALAGSVTILHGQTSATVTVMPLDDIALESNEPVVLTLVSGSGYHLGTTYSAAVTITDNDSIVTVTATDASASETGPDAGVYTFTRTGSSGNLVVNYTMGGTATNSSDYSALSGAVTIPNGQTSATLTLTPIDDLVGEGSETAILTLTTNATYTIGLANAATVTIADNEPTVTLNVTDASAAETGANPATFTVTRNNSIGNLTVNYAISGTAVNSSDYSSLSGSVTIPNGQTSAVVTVTPIDDPTGEGNETVTLTLAAGAYFIGSPNTDNATIADNDNVNVDFSLNPGWTGLNNTTSGNNYGYSPTTSNASGSTGEIGGLFVRSLGKSYFADTHLSATYNLNNLVSGGGKVTVFGQSNTDGEWFLGHMSSSAVDGSGVGIEFLENNATSVRVRARLASPFGGPSGATGNLLTVPNGDYSFSYTYDPNLGTSGRITVRIFNGSFDQTSTVDISSDDRANGGTFNAFGIGIIPGVANDTDTNKTVQMFVDDVTYTGYQAPFAVDGFESGNGTGGTGWGGVWTFAGAATVTNAGTPANGGFHLQLTGTGAIASRPVSLVGATTARLVFDWKANSFEPGETAVVEAFDGTTWINMLTISDGQDDNVYHHADISLSAAFFTSSFQVRVRSLMSAADDFVYIDDLRIAR